MFGKLLILFTVVPVVELWVLIRIGAVIGAIPTVLIVIGTGLAGAHLAREQGFSVWARIHQELAMGRIPTDAMIDGLLVFAAAVTLITPGFITDIFGFLLLIPATRAPVRRFLSRRLRPTIRPTIVVDHEDITDDH